MPRKSASTTAKRPASNCSTSTRASLPRRSARPSSRPAPSARRSSSSSPASAQPSSWKNAGFPWSFQFMDHGNPELLEKRGIPVVHELKGVGENLHDHLQIRMQYKVKNVKTLNGVANSFAGKAAMALEYFLFRTGPLTMPPSQAGAFARSDRGQPSPNIE